MKSLLNFRAGALVLGLALAFAGSAFKSANTNANTNESRVTGWFATDREGKLIEPYELVDPNELCHGGNDFCAKEYNIVNDQPVSATGSQPAMRPEL